MSPTATAPTTRDWGWFGSQPVASIAKIGVDESDPATWVRGGYAWLYERLTNEDHDHLPPPIADPSGPPKDRIPFPGVRPDGNGCIGFVSVEFSDTRPRRGTDDTEDAVQSAADYLSNAFRQLDHSTKFPRVLPEVASGGGRSLALSALLASATALLSTEISEDVIATGDFSNCGKQQQLKPVNAESLSKKVEVARDWGYKRFLVVESQDGIPRVPGISIERVPAEPLHALFWVLENVLTAKDDIALARLLVIFDHQKVRDMPNDCDLDQTVKATSPFVGADVPPLVRFVAHDIRSRVYLHAGQTGKAVEQKEKAAILRSSLEIPDGWLGDYIKWHQVAHHSVVALDQGYWEDEQPDHKLLDKRLTHLSDQLADDWAGRPEQLAALFLSNTRALRHLFLGRMHRDLKRLEQAWKGFTQFNKCWSGLFDYCSQQGLRDSNLHRQQNYCIDAAADHKQLCGKLPRDWTDFEKLEFWPDHETVEIAKLESFDLAYFIRWKAITDQQLPKDSIDHVLTKCADCNWYPFFLVSEAILRYSLGTDEQRSRAAKLLLDSELFGPDLTDTSILTLLALRAEQLLDEIGVEHRPAIRPQTGTPLHRLAVDLLSRPDEIVARCPY